MEWKEFWKLIDAGVKDPQVVKDRLRDLSEQDLVDFWWRLQERADQISEEDYAEQVEEPFDEDDVEDIAIWVVHQGYKFYEDVLFEPEKFPSALPEDGIQENYQDFVGDLYHERYGESMRRPQDPPPTGA